MVGQNAEAPVGYVAKASSGPCMCRRSGWGLDSCGKLCCARSPYTATDPSNKYFFGKHPNPTARTDANLCWEALPSPPCGLNEYRTETGGDCKAVVAPCGLNEYRTETGGDCKAVKVTCGDGAEVVDGECVAKVACGAGTKNENGKCVPEVTCGGGTEVVNGECVPEVAKEACKEVMPADPPVCKGQKRKKCAKLDGCSWTGKKCKHSGEPC